jgi:hypothetical protein
MPQMELVKYNGGDNIQVLNYVRGQLAGTDYDNRVPAATKSNIQDVLQTLWEIPQNRNQFVDALMNRIGLTELRYNSYTNPLAKYKRGMMTMGESIEEVALGLLVAKAYNPDADYLEQILFAREPNEVQSRWHRIDRNDMYKITVNQSLLKRAFLNPNGLSQFVTGLMSTVSTSDEFDEFEIMLNLLNTYYEEDGFFKIAVPDINNLSADGNDAKHFLKVVRAWANKLPLKPSRAYNAAHMPIVPRMEIANRTTIVPDDDIRIPGFQGVITTKEFWICADTYLDMVPQQNVAGRYTNYFHHHESIISASPFVPALLLTSAEKDTVSVVNYRITGVGALTITSADDDETVISNSTVERGEAYIVAGVAIADPAGAPEQVTGLTLSITGNQSTRTRINQHGVLVIGYDEQSTSIVIHAQATGDDSFESETTLTLTGGVVEITIGSNYDANTQVINAVQNPVITPESDIEVGTTLNVSNGSWDTKGLSYARQWTADGTNISGATNPTYTVQPGDVGKGIACVITPSKSGFTAVAATSNTVSVEA